MYKLLVIDDEPFIRRGIVSLIPFEELGVKEVFEAANGVEGLKIVMEKEPHIILCDINMPKLNGLDFAKKVKEAKPWIKIAIITGYDFFDYAKQALKIGVEDYILKPVSKQDVYEVIATLIKKIERDNSIREVYKSLEMNQDESFSIDATGYKQQIDIIVEAYLGSEEFSLTLLAQELGLSVSYLSTLFKRLYGKPFQDYILSERLEKSKRLLLTTSMKNYEIADSIGISDPNYFSTLFRKKYGESPNKYKQKVRGNKK